MTSLEAALREQAAACERLGSPLYARLLRCAAADEAASGPVRAVLRGHEDDSPGSMLGGRLLAAVHRLVLTDRAPALAAHYPSAGGTQAVGDAWEAFRATVGEHLEVLRELLERPVQTNEIGRCAALLRGFLLVAERIALPLRVLELGASAGLNLRWDHVRYGEGAEGWGPADSLVRLPERQQGLPAVAVRVAERRGCDADPLDPASAQDRLTLRSCVWPDQPERLVRLDAALALAERVPVTVDRAGAADWLAVRPSG